MLLSCQSHHYHHYHHYLHQALGNQAIRGAAHVGFSEKVLTLSQADIYTPSLYVYMIAKINIIITIIVIRQGQCFCSALPSLNHHVVFQVTDPILSCLIFFYDCISTYIDFLFTF